MGEALSAVVGGAIVSYYFVEIEIEIKRVKRTLRRRRGGGGNRWDTCVRVYVCVCAYVRMCVCVYVPGAVRLDCLRILLSVYVVVVVVVAVGLNERVGLS